jgi:hypothetical protein
MAVGRDLLFDMGFELWLVFFTFPKLYVCRCKGFSLEEKSLQTDIAGDDNQNFLNYSPVS